MGNTAAEVQREIGELRKDTDQLVGELESRARKALDWRAQVRRHPAIAAGTGIALVVGLALAGYAAYGRMGAKRGFADVARRQPGEPRELVSKRGKDFGWRAFPALEERSEESLLKKVLYAALTAGVVALATFMARRIVDTIWAKTMHERPPGAPVDRLM